VGLAEGVIEAAQGRRARSPRAHRCTGRSRTTPSAHSATFFGSCKMPNSSILPRGKASAGAKAAAIPTHDTLGPLAQMPEMAPPFG